jgi:hypothetical protein
MSKLTQKIGKEIKFSSKLPTHEGGGIKFKVEKETLKMLKNLESELSPLGFINDEFVWGGGSSTNYTYGVSNPKNGLSIWVDDCGDEPFYCFSINGNDEGEEPFQPINDINSFIESYKILSTLK